MKNLEGKGGRDHWQPCYGNTYHGETNITMTPGNCATNSYWKRSSLTVTAAKQRAKQSINWDAKDFQRDTRAQFVAWQDMTARKLGTSLIDSVRTSSIDLLMASCFEVFVAHFICFPSLKVRICLKDIWKGTTGDLEVSLFPNLYCLCAESGNKKIDSFSRDAVLISNELNIILQFVVRRL